MGVCVCVLQLCDCSVWVNFETELIFFFVQVNQKLKVPQYNKPCKKQVCLKRPRRYVLKFAFPSNRLTFFRIFQILCDFFVN